MDQTDKAPLLGSPPARNGEEGSLSDYVENSSNAIDDDDGDGDDDNYYDDGSVPMACRIQRRRGGHRRGWKSKISRTLHSMGKMLINLWHRMRLSTASAATTAGQDGHHERSFLSATQFDEEDGGDGGDGGMHVFPPSDETWDTSPYMPAPGDVSASVLPSLDDDGDD